MSDERQTVSGAYAKIQAHEDLCAERYANIHSALGELKKLVWGIVLGVAGFACVTLVGLLLRGSGLS